MRVARILPVALLGALPFGPGAGCSPGGGTMGAILAREPDGRVLIREVPPGLSAARHGLRPGDEILLVDGRDVRALGDRELHAALSGDIGTEVRLTVVQGETARRVTLILTPAPAARVAAPPARDR